MLRSLISLAFSFAPLGLFLLLIQLGLRIGWTFGWNWHSALLFAVFYVLNWSLESIRDRVLARFPKAEPETFPTLGIGK